MKLTALAAHLALLFLVSCVGDPVENVEKRQEIIDAQPTEPVISTISPTESPEAGGSTLTITGARLENTVVSVGGSNCSIATQSASIITCTLPSGTDGSADIVVLNGSGESATNTSFQYRAAPTITSIDTSYGVTTGSTAVVITGTGFYNITDIQFGTISCTSVVTVSDTSASCTTGANSAGTYDITVTNSDGQTGSGSNLFTYELAPTITSFSPTTIFEAGSQTLTITGTNFVTTPTDPTVSIDGNTCTVTSASGTSIDCTTPVGTGTGVNVVVTNPSGIQVSSTIDYIPVPTITSISQNFGTTAGSDTINIVGTGFVSGGSFGITAAGVACTTSTFTSATAISCTTAASGATSGNVVVTNNDGQTVTSTGTFEYRVAPGISSISPTAGAVGGATAVTITGTGFSTDGNMTVSIGGNACSSVSVASATSLTCLTPAGSAGQVDVTVTNTEDNQTSNTLTNAYTYQVAPSVTSITPQNFGPIAGGNTISIIGTDFSAGATVAIDGSACTSPNTVNSSQIDCVVPAHAAGLENVLVTNSDGQSYAFVSGYTYTAPPTITNVDPPAGPTTGGQTITVTGTNFFPGISFDVNSVACTSPTYVSATSATCVTPSNGGIGGPFTVDVTNADGQTGTMATAYEYIAAPTVTSISPSFGPVAGGTTITVTGTGFYVAEGVSATINGVICSNVQNLTATTFDCDTGDNTAAGGAYTISVTNDVDGQSGSGGAFNYVAAPTVTSVENSGGGTTIDGGSTLGGNTVRIVGTGFQTGMQVTIGSAACTETDVDANNIECAIPAGTYTAQAETITVTNTDGQAGTLANGYTFRDPPTIVSYDYAIGPTTGGNTITITGTNFYDGANFNISIGGTNCTTATYVSATSATCEAPAGVLGAADVVVTGQDLQTVTDTGGYTYVAAPAITSFSPTTIYEVGSQTLTINGSDFYAGASVTINSLACTSVNVVSSTQITCTTPASTGTAVAVVVTNADGQASSGDTIDYIPAPTISSYDYAYGPTTGGNTITLTGTNFVGGGSFDITIGGTSCTTPAVTSSTTATCQVPGGGTLGTADVIFINNDGQFVTDTAAFTYVAAPTISSFSPTTIYEAGSQTLTITGTGFLTGATVTVNSLACTSPTVVSATSMTCVTPASTGTGVAVVVTNADGQTGSSTIDYIPAPTFASFSPTTIYEAGSQTLTINGGNFVATPTITIGGNACTSPSWVNAGQLTCTTPAGTGTSSAVVITNPDGQTVSTTIDYIPAPAISSYDYAYGPTTGGNTITLTGTNFVGGGSFDITIGGTSCTTPAVTSSTTATCQVPVGALGSADIVFINNDGQSVTDSGAFTYVAAPTISSFSPTTIYEAGSQTLTITGTGFLTGATVTVNSLACTSPTVVSATSMTCVTPASTGTGVAVVVTNADGQTGSSTIDYIPAPTITTFSPTTINEAGGQTLTINGTNFVSAPTVTIGGNGCGSVSYIGATQITCTTPGGAGAAAAVVLTNPDGQTASSTIDYKPAPVITTATTSAGAYGQSAGSETLTLTGTGFFDDIGSPTITINSITCSAPTVVSSTSITCTTGVTAAGTYDVVITNADGQTDTLSNGFTFTDAPTFSSVTPSTGAVAGGTAIVIAGTGFSTGTTVTVGGVSCIGTIITSATQIDCTTPSGTAGAADIVISVPAQTALNAGGGSAYTYLNPAPTISSLSPQGGPINGTNTVTINGSDFVSAPTVTIGGNSCTGVSFVSSSQITCTAPDNTSAGFEDVVVTNPDTQTVTLSTGYLFATGPTLTSITPTSGDITGGTTITLTGTDFGAPATITVGGASCTNIQYDSSTQMRCDTPAGSVGAADVVVTRYYQDSTLSSAFTYNNGAVLAWQTGAGSPNPPNPADWGDPGADTGYTFTLENTGSATSSSITISLSGTNASVWTIVSDNCSGTTLNAGTTCTVQAFFNWSLLPDSATVYTATLEATATTGGTTTNDLQGQNL